MIKALLTTLLLLSAICFTGYAQDSTNVSTSNYFISFVKKVYLNPTVLLKTQNFRSQHNVRVMVLPDMNGQTDNTITAFERAMQKIIRFLIEGDDEGTIRLYFDATDTSSPFSLVASDELYCKFSTANRDSITRRLNAPFQNVPFTINSHTLFETALEDGLDYAGQCLAQNTAECGEQPDFETTVINTKPLSISLHNTTGSKYDTDKKTYNPLESQYAKAEDLFTGSDWYAPAKFMLANAPNDEPVAIAIDKHETPFKKQNLTFRSVYNQQVIPIQPSSTNDTIKLLLPKTLPPGAPLEIVITYESPVDSITYTVGFFMVYVYEAKPVKVNVVAVNNFTLDAAKQLEIKTELDKIYKPVGVTFEVVKRDITPDSELPLSITIESSGLLSNYPPDLRGYVSAVKEIAEYDSDEFYIVYGLSTDDLDGYMPRARNIGFVFSGAASVGKTTAHELGHGAFHLRHIFADEELGPNSLGSTPNLMDYVDNPKELYLHQWKGIDDPGFVSWTGGDDEEGASAHVLNGIPRRWFQSDSTICFLTPGLSIIKLSKFVSDAWFSLFLDDVPGNELAIHGTLITFMMKNPSTNVETRYDAVYEGSSFKGYADGSGVLFTGVVAQAPGDSVVHITMIQSKSVNVFKFKNKNYPYYSGQGTLRVVHDLSNYAVIELDVDWNPWPVSIHAMSNDFFKLGDHIIATEVTNLFSRVPSNFTSRQITEKIVMLASLYPDLFAKMSSLGFGAWKGNAGYISDRVPLCNFANALMAADAAIHGFTEATVTSSDYDGMCGYFDYQFYANNYGVLPEEEILHKFLVHFRELIVLYKAEYGAIVTAILSDCDGSYSTSTNAALVPGILEAVHIMTTVQIGEMCNKLKVNLIGLMLNPDVNNGSLGMVTDSYERAIVKLVKNTTEANSSDLLDRLCATKFAGELIVKTLADAVDDETCWIGEDNFKWLMNWIIKTYNTYPHELSCLVNPSYPVTEEEIKLLKSRTVSYTYTGFVKRLFNSYLKTTVCGPLIPGDKMTEVTFNSNGQVGIKNYLEVFFMDLSSAQTVYYDPLAPLVIIDDAKLLEVSNPTNYKNGFVAPAVVLYFLEKKASSKTTQAVIQTAADVASLVIPGGAAYKILTYADKISSIASLAGAYAEDDYPQLSQTLNITSSVLGLGSMSGEFFFSGLKTVDNVDDAIHLMHTSDPNIVSHVQAQNYGDNMITMENRVLAAVNPDAPVSVQRTADRGMLDNNSSRGMLIDILENERNTLQASGYISEVNHYNLMLTKIKGFKNLFTDNFFYRQFSNLGEYWGVNKLFKSANKIPGETILEAVNADDLRLFTKTPSGNIGPDAEFVGVFEGAHYFDGATATTKKTGDIYIYKENGNLKVFCLNGTSCFVEHTPVTTSEGLKPIENVQVNDSVLSFNEQTMQQSYNRVTRLIRKNTDHLVKLVTGQDTLFVTGQHPFFTSQGWVNARDLIAGMFLLTASGTQAVAHQSWIDTTAAVYNFEVENDHTYAVGEEQLFVHNVCAVINDLLTSGKLKPEQLQDFMNAYANNQSMLAKFASGELHVRAWELTSLSPLTKTDAWVKMTSSWINAGGELTEVNGVVKLRKGGVDILEIKNGKILPSQYDLVKAPNATLIGDPSNGYQVIKDNGVLSVRRVPDESAYNALEKTLLTDHPNAHVLDRHGPDVTDEALIKRANTGIAPDGNNPGFKPPYASKFESPDQLKKALTNTQPGTPAFNSVPATNGRKTVTHDLTDGTSYGKGVIRDGSTFQQATKVTAKYEEVSPNVWKLVTMYPDF